MTASTRLVRPARLETLAPRRLSLALQLALVTMATTAAIPGQALADAQCHMVGNACVITSTGATATPAPGAKLGGDGHNGGNGNVGADFNLTLQGPASYTYDSVSPALWVQSTGSDGAQGSDAYTPGVVGKHGGNGGLGGNGGHVQVTVPDGVSGDASGGSLFALALVSQGGTGGAAGYSMASGSIATAGTGGIGNTVTANVGGRWTASGTAALIASVGGDGGRGRDHNGDLGSVGPDGNTGGDGGLVTTTISGYFAGEGGVTVLSRGGDGGGGGAGPTTEGGEGGDGGTGGDGGNVNVRVTAPAQLIATGSNNALLVQSLGGLGGTHGGGHDSGLPGAGGNASDVTVDLAAQLIANSSGDAATVLVQSLGAAGENGGSAGHWDSGATDGGAGGAAGNVTVTGGGATILSGTAQNPTANSSAVLAQSIGGGGGAGGNGDGWTAIGGSGANGSAGESASIDLAANITTYGNKSHGMAAQSIGGGGGNGGNAKGSSIGFQMSIGGVAGGGGDGGAVFGTNEGTIHTHGAHAAGMLLQGIGGGGGDGGAAISNVTSTVVGVGVALGGTGGAGGKGGTVGAVATKSYANTGRIITSGSDGDGILGQSIGGGGGLGGAALSDAIVEAPPGGDDLPSLSLTVSLGGNGGAGGNGQAVSLGNAGLIATSGAGAGGVVAQSIGGGGGSGGDSSATSTAKGAQWNLAASLAMGGAGDTAGDGGNASASNDGLILTSGESADGLLVQSIGGGGGKGGNGDGQAKSSGDGVNVSLTMGGGGKGAAGGAGYQAVANNSGSILTLGDGASGVVVQTIGGGGGKGGGAAGTTSGTYKAQVTVGGSGGNGGSTFGTGLAQVVNTGNILTFGADAPAILAQSIAGGGGAGGKAASSIGSQKSSGDGGNGNKNTLGNDYDSLNTDWSKVNKGLENLTQLGQQLLGGSGVSAGRLEDEPDDLEDLADSNGSNDDETDAKSISINVAVGGSGGGGGAAGAVSIINQGDIATTGRLSDGILAQAIGGGGGKGGAATSSTSGDYSGALALGASGGAGGAGGSVTIQNDAAITTIGALAAGIVGQSVAGGGGMAGASSASAKSSGDTPTLLSGMALSIGGNGGGGADSGQVIVTNSGTVTTTSHDAIGMLGQSIAGGGGILKTLATDIENTGGGAKASSSDYALGLKFGGSKGSSGQSGLVWLKNAQGANVITHGDNSYGMLAQSISGGGGVVLGGKINGTSGADFFGSGEMSGSVLNDNVNDGSGNSGVLVDNAGHVTTTGNGAVGIFAQSIGGGGGIAGDTSWTQALVGLANPANGKTNHDGNGGYLSVTVSDGGSVTTQGANAPAIVAQSLGGGGGRFTNKNAAYNGSAGGSGNGGPIVISVEGAVAAAGEASMGIYAQSQGGYQGTGAPISITVAKGGSVSGGPLFNNDDAGNVTPAIFIDTGSKLASQANTVTNHGTLTTLGGAQGTAVWSQGGITNVSSDGNLTGQVLLDNDGGSGTLSNGVGGVFTMGKAVSLGGGQFSNAGTLVLGGVDGHVVSGDFVNRGTIMHPVDFTAGRASLLQVQGHADLSGTLQLLPSTLGATPLTLVSATSLDARGLAVRDAGGYLFTYQAASNGQQLQVTPQSHFGEKAAGLHSSGQSLGQGLDGMFATDDGRYGHLFAQLSHIGDQAQYQQALQGLLPATSQAIGASRLAASRSFVARMQSCPDANAPGLSSQETDCVWGRVINSGTRGDESIDGTGYRLDTSTVQFGMQRELDRGWFIGGALGYENSDLSANSVASQVDGRAWSAGMVVKYQRDGWTFSASADASQGRFDTRRRILLGDMDFTADGRFDSRQFGLHGRVARRFDHDNLYLKPYLDVNATRVKTGAYTEQGAGDLNAQVAAASDTVYAASPVLEVGSVFKLDGGMQVRAFADIGGVFYSRGTWASDVRLTGAATAVSDVRLASELPGSRLRFGAGVELSLRENLDLKLEYQGEQASGYRANGGEFKVTYRY